MAQLNLQPLLWVMLGMLLMYLMERNTPKDGFKYFGYVTIVMFSLIIFVLLYEIGFISLMYGLLFKEI